MEYGVWRACNACCGLLVTILLLLPVGALEAAQSGFPSQALWVSSVSASEGETIIVSTVVVNDTHASLTGTVAFTANANRIGERTFALPSGQSQIHSIEWKPKRGEYKLVARIEGTSTELSQKETSPLVVVVKEPPPPPSEIQKTIAHVVQVGSSVASTSAPLVKETAQNIFSQTEQWRQAGIRGLQQYLAANATGTATQTPKGSIAGTSTSAKNGSANSDANVFSKIAQTAAAAALAVFKNSALFYPILAFLVLGSLYLLARRIRRRSQDD